MPAKRSAGILLHRRAARRRAARCCSSTRAGRSGRRRTSARGRSRRASTSDGEDARAAARREFAEELGSPAADGELVDLGEVRQKSGKVVTAWALEGDIDADAVTSNTFTMEWPPRSGRTREFPEVDRAAWFGLDEARERILPAQAPLLDRLAERG